MIDSHCHLDHDPLFSNINEILNRSKTVGLKKILTICTSNKSFENIQKILEIDEIIYGTYGIHPHETKNNKVTKNIIIENIKKHPKLIGIGGCIGIPHSQFNWGGCIGTIGIGGPEIPQMNSPQFKANQLFANNWGLLIDWGFIGTIGGFNWGIPI